MSEDLLVRQDGPILRITINRPQDGNRVTDEMARELTDLLLGTTAPTRLILLSSNGAEFSNGWTGPSNPPPPGGLEALAAKRQFDTVFNCYGAFRRAQVPVVGVVRGHARGFGCSAAALCDITVAADTAKFQIPEMGFNVLPTMVMSSLIDRVPAKALSYLVYTTEIIDAQAALSVGIASKVVPEKDLDRHVEELCATLLKRPQAALKGVKEYVSVAAYLPQGPAVDFARNLHATINTSHELRPPKH